MKLNLPILSLFVVMVIGCNSETEMKPKTQFKKSEHSLASSKKSAPDKSGFTFRMNRSIFTSESQKLMQGVRLFDLSTKEYCRVKGDIVFVSNASIEELKSFGQQIERVTKNTWRLNYMKGEDLYSEYKKLEKSPLISLIEISLIYEPIAKPEVTM
ncbi:hypothetical protein SOPP22_03895 [Shewanella sp. OPT22]|nr:hypothetical protein SOPP22_03895 [Shewanella sp. OPT22]